MSALPLSLVKFLLSEYILIWNNIACYIEISKEVKHNEWIHNLFEASIIFGGLKFFDWQNRIYGL